MAPNRTGIEQRPFRRLIVIGIKVLLAIAVTVYVLAVASPWQQPRLTLIWAARRSGGCSFRETIDSYDRVMNIPKIGDRFASATHVVQEDPSGLQLFETPRGRYWAVKNDKFLRYALAEQELQIYGTDGHGVRSGDVVLDCGANVGVFTRTALSRGARLVVAIEPTPATVECLRRNFQQEIVDRRVLVYPKGVWDHVDTLELALGEEGNTTGNSFVLGRNVKTKVKLPLTTIDNLVRELNLDRVDFIKMDIEGAEKQALRGGAQTIKRFSPRMAIATEHLPDDLTKIPEVVNSIRPGYQIISTDCQDHYLSVEPEVLLFETR